MPTFFGSFRKSHLKPGPLAPREPSMCTHPHCTQPLFRRPYRRTVSPRSSSQALQQPVASQDPSDARHRQRGQAGRARDEVGQHHAVESARGHSEVDIISDRSAAAVPALSAPGAGFGLAQWACKSRCSSAGGSLVARGVAAVGRLAEGAAVGVRAETRLD
ncbi:hypothetical protein B0H13DRAFT_2370103 [Mycena leptocephala]|nr:hypothetical protein B0H13DRAFT_2370103 [Mycena leptocephala]